MEHTHFLSAQEVAQLMGISIPLAYKIIRKLNEELKDQGYITIAGRINQQYFLQKIHCEKAV